MGLLLCAPLAMFYTFFINAKLLSYLLDFVFDFDAKILFSFVVPILIIFPPISPSDEVSAFRPTWIFACFSTIWVNIFFNIFCSYFGSHYWW